MTSAGADAGTGKAHAVPLPPLLVIPAQAGIHFAVAPDLGSKTARAKVKMDPSFRWDDELNALPKIPVSSSRTSIRHQ
jgi:hypothetical protein